MSLPQLKLTHPKLLLGEGRDEEIVFRRLLKDAGISGVQVLNYDGRDNCASCLAAIADHSNCPSQILVTRDADDDPASAAQSLRDAIVRADFSSKRVQVDAWVIPDHQSIGAIEDLFWRDLLVAQPAQTKCVDALFECAGVQTPSGKARMHAWIALQSRPWLRLREAVEQGFLSVQSPSFEPLINKLRGFFA